MVNRLKQWFKQVLKKLAVWALVKLASAGIDEADGVKTGKEIKSRAPEPIVKALDGWLREVREGLT